MDNNLVIYSEKMTKTIESLNSDLQGIRAGRANPHILDKLKVDYYGVPTPINSMGNISVPEPRMLVVQVWDANGVGEVAKAIQNSDIGITPIVDGTTIRLNFPELTEDRRKELVKQIKKKGEDAKVAIRNIRRDGNDAFKKLKGSDYSEDMIKDLEDTLQKLTDESVKKIDGAIDNKSKEILTV